ncbi:hypothetical protein SAMN05661080_02364 [Modestobacter sp. DSM 44400]|uniref:hypothetical protein n=1 Tax=Modestobacter sp. DSM 44400 TaxID=1550230 RepID=UPI000898EB5C|nr:hypothetical protein [Modestobacter sp. DSM 44400]SDY11386.1 hypothetical protein SAMN05661080_02364 [Modestobacter sp. DSM 44400]
MTEPEWSELDATGLRVLSDAALVLVGEDVARVLADLAAVRDEVQQEDRTPSR